MKSLLKITRQVYRQGTRPAVRRTLGLINTRQHVLSPRPHQPTTLHGPATFRHISTTSAVFSALTQSSQPTQPGAEELPIVDLAVQMGKDNGVDMSRTAVVYVHHALGTSPNVLNAMFEWGLQPQNTWVIGKTYSNNQQVIDVVKAMGAHYTDSTRQTALGQFEPRFVADIHELWFHFKHHYIKNPGGIDQILVLDHGGYASRLMPPCMKSRYPTIGVEKTTFGVLEHRRMGDVPLPIINMARAATKKFLEAPLIAQATWEKLRTQIGGLPKDSVCGVVGFGAIGSAVAAKLYQEGYSVYVYDKTQASTHRIAQAKRPRMQVCSSITNLISSSDVIFGCTGDDITFDVEVLEAFRLSTKSKMLISTSTEDREFLTLLRSANEQRNARKKNHSEPFDPFSPQQAVYNSVQNKEIQFVYGGFPVNFDSTGVSVAPNDIQLTRALLLGAVGQGVLALDGIRAARHDNQNGRYHLPSGFYAVCSSIQSKIAKAWIADFGGTRFNGEATRSFSDLDWITSESEGEELNIERRSSPKEEPHDVDWEDTGAFSHYPFWEGDRKGAAHDNSETREQQTANVSVSA